MCNSAFWIACHGAISDQVFKKLELLMKVAWKCTKLSQIDRLVTWRSEEYEGDW